MLFGNDEMLAFNRPTISAVGRQLQWMIQHPGDLCELETGESGMVRITEGRRQNQPERLTQEIVIRPSVNLPEALIELHHQSIGVGTHKGKILLFTQSTDRFNRPGLRHLTPPHVTSETRNGWDVCLAAA